MIQGGVGEIAGSVGFAAGVAATGFQAIDAIHKISQIDTSEGLAPTIAKVASIAAPVLASIALYTEEAATVISATADAVTSISTPIIIGATVLGTVALLGVDAARGASPFRGPSHQ